MAVRRRVLLGLLLLTLATGMVDAISILIFGRVFVANMTGNVIFLGFWVVPHSGIDLTACSVSFAAFLVGAILGGLLARRLDHRTRRWITIASVTEISLLVLLAALAGTGVVGYHSCSKLILVAGLALSFGLQNATARHFGIAELSTTVVTSTIVGVGVDWRVAGGSGHNTGLRVATVLTLCAGAAIGAALSRVTVAPVIAVAAGVVACAAGLLRLELRPHVELAG